MLTSTSRDTNARNGTIDDDDGGAGGLGLVNVVKSPGLKQLQEDSEIVLTNAIDGIKGTFSSLLEKAAEADSLKDQLAAALEDNERLRSREQELVQKLEEERGRVAELEEEAKEREAAMGRTKKLVQLVRDFHRGTRSIILQEERKGKVPVGKRKSPSNSKRERVLLMAADEAGDARVDDAPSPDLFTPRRRRKQSGEDKGERSGGSRQLALPGGGGAELAVPRGGGAELATARSGCSGGKGEIVTEFEEGFRGSDYTKEEAVQLIIDKVPNRKSCNIEYRNGTRYCSNQLMTIRAHLTWFETPSEIVHHVEYNNDYFTLSGWLTEIKDRSKKWKENVYLAADSDPDGGGSTLLRSIHPFSGNKQANALWKKKSVPSSA